MAGAQIVTEQNPSPRSASQVAVSLSYRRNPKPAGTAYDQLEPGACTWNPVGDANLPAEPGIVHFDLDPQGSAAVPDPVTLTTHSTIGGATGGSTWTTSPTSPSAMGPTARRSGRPSRSPRPRPDRAPGGAASLPRRRRVDVHPRCGAKAGTCLAMRLDYKVAASAAGPVGKGSSPVTALADRTDAKMESGRIRFATAGNAQLKQVQSGSVVDTTATAAERWPDVHTIPAYLKDPAHYWSFAVSLASPDTALRHGAEAVRPGFGASYAGAKRADHRVGRPVRRRLRHLRSSRSTTSSLPTLAGGGRREDADPTSNMGSTWHLHDVLPSTLLETLRIWFCGPPWRQPDRAAQSAASRARGDGFQTFRGTPIQMNVYEKPDLGRRARTLRRNTRSSAAPSTTTSSTFPATATGSRASSPWARCGTWQQTAQVVFTEIQMVSDGDSDGAGELMFNFTAGDGHRTLGQDDGPPLEWDDGTRHAINVPITGLWPTG